VPNNSRGRSLFAGPDARPCLAAGCGPRSADRARTRFREPRWNSESPEWLKLDRWLHQDDLARKIARLVDEDLDLDPLFSSYAGRGTPPHRPDLLLKLVLYEHQTGRPKPTQWLEHLEENKAVEWLTFGIEAGRSVLYEFRDRVRPFLAAFNQQVIRTAIDEKHTDASTASLDGTFVAANASRHRLLALKTVEKRLEQLDQEIAKIEAAEVARQEPQSAAVTCADEAVETGVVAEAIPARSETEPNRQPPATESPSTQPTTIDDKPLSFMGKTKRGMKRQRAQYRRAREILNERNKTNARRRKDKRKKCERVRLAIGDPTAPYGRDKMKVFRPVYNI
jgi:transposase